MKEIYIQEQQFFLHWQKALWWPEQKTLLVADTHFSKDSVFRQHGIAIPQGSNQQDLMRLTSLLFETKAERLIVLGDFVHGKMPIDDPFLKELMLWQNHHSTLSFEVVAGNHDRHIDKRRFEKIQWHQQLDIGSFRLKHEPEEEPNKYVMAGHLHPVLNLKLGAGDKITLPVFLCKTHLAILPSFGSMTGGYKIKADAEDRIYVFGENDVMQIQ